VTNIYIAIQQTYLTILFSCLKITLKEEDERARQVAEAASEWINPVREARAAGGYGRLEKEEVQNGKSRTAGSGWSEKRTFWTRCLGWLVSAGPRRLRTLLCCKTAEFTMWGDCPGYSHLALVTVKKCKASWGIVIYTSDSYAMVHASRNQLLKTFICLLI